MAKTMPGSWMLANNVRLSLLKVGPVNSLSLSSLRAGAGEKARGVGDERAISGGGCLGRGRSRERLDASGDGDAQTTEGARAQQVPPIDRSTDRRGHVSRAKSA